MADKKTKQCIRCKETRDLAMFPQSPSPFLPQKRSYICIPCLEQMCDPTDLDSVDAVMRWGDWAFDPNKWTQLYATHKNHTLGAYFSLLADQAYDNATWAKESARWAQIREQGGDPANYIDTLSDAEAAETRKMWGSSYSPEELQFLNDYYNSILATQNVSTPILQKYARNICELELRIMKGIRAGEDVKKEMDARDNAIKMANFSAANSKNATDFDSVGELITYCVKMGWNPKWHTEPQDSIDFIMKNNQDYLRRLTQGEGNFAEQVEDKRAQYDLAERIESEETSYHYDTNSDPVEFEDNEEDFLDGAN